MMTIKLKAIRTYLKSLLSLKFVYFSANINTVHFEQMFVKTLILLVISNNLAFQQVSSPGAEASVVTVISRQMSPVFTDFPASTETTAEVYHHVFDLFMF